jgi:serine/threonine protein kinase
VEDGRHVEDGRRVAGRYHLLEPIGRGGMGVVWRAHDELIDRPVAVKEVLYRSGNEDDRQAFNRRTIREARAAGRVTHPNVVVVYDVVEEDGRPWIVMQLVEARSLGQVLREHGPLVPERVASIGLQVLEALCTAHAAGVLHRDVKPENVLLAAGNRVVLTDFGIAKTPEDTAITMTGDISGTPAFLPPERLSGRPATPESDLWSLGATLYAAVEGRPPFHRNTPIATIAAVLHDEPEPPRRAGALTPVIEGLLQKNPGLRMDAVEAGELLRAALSGPPAGSFPGAALDAGAPQTRRNEARPASSPADASHGHIPGSTVLPAQDTASRSSWSRSSWSRSTAAGDPRVDVPGAQTVRGRPGRRPAARLILLVLAPVLVAAAGLGGWYGYHTLAAGPSSSASGGPGLTQSSVPGSPTPPGPSPSPSESRPQSPSPSPPASPSPSPSVSPSPSASPSPSGAVNPPAGWVMHDDPLGFSIALPRGWTEFGREPARVRFHGPGTRDYLLVDLTRWTREEPVAALAAVEKTSRAEGLLPGYRRIRLGPRPYMGLPAADWEFTFTPSYGKVRVIDRAFRLPDGRYVTIYWQAADSRWITTLSSFKVFASTFRPR